MTHAHQYSVCVPFPAVRSMSSIPSNHSDFETQKTEQSCMVQTGRADLQSAATEASEGVK